MGWVTERLRMGEVPRTADVLRHHRETRAGLPPAGRGGPPAPSRREIVEALRLHPAYRLTSRQQREPKRSRRHRPILSNSLGVLHADIGYFPKSRDFETPRRFQAGFLVAKDVLSRFTYAVVLPGSKSASAMIRAFEELLRQHEEAFPGGHRILSISFDRETSVASRRVQDFLAERGIAYHPFKLSASKAKHAEGAIRLIREAMARRLAAAGPRGERRWWRDLRACVDALNARPVVVEGRRLPFAPRDVGRANLREFLLALQRAQPGYLFGQFDVDPRLLRFKFRPGDLVRPKLLVTSSAVIGVKRSAVSLEKEIFEVREPLAFANQAGSVGKAYRCTGLRTGELQVFDEWDLALTRPDDDDDENPEREPEPPTLDDGDGDADDDVESLASETDRLEEKKPRGREDGFVSSRLRPRRAR
jgi:hypothetical protein